MEAILGLRPEPDEQRHVEVGPREVVGVARLAFRGVPGAIGSLSDVGLVIVGVVLIAWASLWSWLLPKLPSALQSLMGVEDGTPGRFLRHTFVSIAFAVVGIICVAIGAYRLSIGSA